MVHEAKILKRLNNICILYFSNNQIKFCIKKRIVPNYIDPNGNQIDNTPQLYSSTLLV
jgi:hypothetical protein